MERVRQILGISSLVLLFVGLNLAVVWENPFVPSVYVPLIGSAIFGQIWLVLKLASALGKGKGSARGLNAVVGTVVWLGICIAAYALVKRSDVSWDLTQEGRRELSPQTVQVLRMLTEDVEVTCFWVRAGGDARVDLAQDKAERFLARCQRVTDRLKVKYIDPQANPLLLEEMGVLRIQSAVGTVVLEAGARQREIPLSDVTSRLEERDFTNALVNIVRDSRPKIYFLMGHGERDILDTDPKVGGSNFALWLEEEAYETARHLIAYTNPEIPADCSILVINKYQADLKPHEIEVLDEYMNNGGRLLILSDPQVAIEGAVPSVEQLRPWLSTRFGVRVGNDILVSRLTEGYKLALISDFNDRRSLGEYARLPEAGTRYHGSFNGEHPITRGLGNMDRQMILSAVRSVEIDRNLPAGVTGSLLLRSTPDTWAETDLRGVLDLKPLSREDYETEGPNGIAVAMTMRTDVPVGDGSRMREARLVIVGDADMSSNEQMNYVSNQSFLLNSVAWLSENEELIAVRPTRTDDAPILLTRGEQRTVAWLASLGPIQAIALVGLGVYLARRKYR